MSAEIIRHENAATISEIKMHVDTAIRDVQADVWSGRETAMPTVWVTVYWTIDGESGCELLRDHKIAVGANTSRYDARSQTFRVLTELETRKAALARLVDDLTNQFVDGI